MRRGQGEYGLEVMSLQHLESLVLLGPLCARGGGRGGGGGRGREEGVGGRGGAHHRGLE